MTEQKEQLVVKKALYDELLSSGPNKFKLIFDPISYAVEAMLTIEEQLKTAQSPKRVKKLLARYNSWKSEVEVLRDLEKERTDAERNVEGAEKESS